MKHNAKRVLGIVLALLLCLGMCTGIVLPAAAVEAEAPADPYAKVTGTEENGVITPDANVYFINSAWATAPKVDENGQFEYTYGDGVTWGNGKTYLLTWDVNAFPNLAKTNDDLAMVLKEQSDAWVNQSAGAKQDAIVVMAPGKYAQYYNFSLTAPSATTTADEYLNIYVLGAQAGKNPVSSDKSTQENALVVQNGRSVDDTKESVLNNLIGLYGNANWTYDGIAMSEKAAFFIYNNGAKTLTVKNLYTDNFTTGWNNKFLYAQGGATMMYEFKDSYLDLQYTTTAASSYVNDFQGNKAVFDNCVFANVDSKTDDGHIVFLPNAKNAASATSFYGEYATNPLFEMKKCTVANWYFAYFVNFNIASANWTTYTDNAVKINIEDSKFYDVGQAASRTRIFDIATVDTLAKANCFQFNMVGNEFNFSDALSKSGVRAVVYTNGAATADADKKTIEIKAHIKNNIFRTPNHTSYEPMASTMKESENGPLFDMSGNLFVDNQGNVMPLRTMHSQGADIEYFEVQSDIYASDEMKGGVRELMTVKEAKDAIVAHCEVQVADRKKFTVNEDYLLATVTLLLKNGKEYDANTLFEFDDPNVKFLGIYTDEKCTQKVETIKAEDLAGDYDAAPYNPGRYAKAQYKAGNTTLNVVYHLYKPHTYLIVDPSGEYKSNGYTFNGIKYEDCMQATDGAYAKFYDTVGDAFGSIYGTTNGGHMPSYHRNAIDAVRSMTFGYTLDGIETRQIPYSSGVGAVILLTPGKHTVSYGNRNNAPIVGPQWDKSPYDAELAAEGKLANGRSYDATKEAIINGTFTLGIEHSYTSIMLSVHGVVFEGNSAAVHFGHNPTSVQLKGSQMQFAVLKNCVFKNNTKQIVTGVTKDDYNRVLDATIKDCVFDTTAQNRTAIADSVLQFRAHLTTIEDVALFSKYCPTENKIATTSRNGGNAAVWTTKVNAAQVSNVTYYAANHNYTEENEIAGTKVDATCMATGSVNFICVCGETATEILPKNAESHTGNNTTGVNASGATCATPGYTGDTVCECGAVLTAGTAIDATNEHKFTVLVTKTDATCKAEGSATYKCETCEATEDKTLEIDPTAHKWETEYTVDVEASCNTAGSKSYHCEYCDAENEASAVEIEATGAHVPANEWTQGEAKHYHACTTEGCTAKLDEADHTESEVIEVIAPQVGVDGVGKVECTECGKVLKDNVVIPALAGGANIGDKNYESLEAALADAKAGDVITLNEDAELDFLALDPEVTLDLNGKKLTAEYVIGFKDSAIIDGSEEGLGLLKVAKDKVALDQNNGGYLPVYDAAKGSYKLITVASMKEAKADDVEKGTYYYFSPDLSEMHDELYAGAEACGVKVVVRLSWTKEGNYTAEQSFVYADKFVRDVIDSYGAEVQYPDYYTKMFEATFVGSEADTADDLTISAVLVSDAGVEIASAGISFAK